MNFVKPLTLSLAFLAFGGTAFARGPGNGGNSAARHEMRARISDEVVTKLATAIGLDAAGTAKMKGIVAKYAAQLETAEQGLAQARKQLRQLVASKSNDATALNQAIDAFNEARRSHEAIQEARAKEIRAAITPAQAAMAILERPRIEKQVRQELLHAAGKTDDEE